MVGRLVQRGCGARSSPLSSLIERILKSDPRNDPLNIQSLLIAKGGKLVVEEYFYGFGKDIPHDMRSASKTFTPLLFGAAIDHGANISPATKVYPLFPEYKNLPMLIREKTSYLLNT